MTMLAEVVDAVIGIDTHRDSHEVEIADAAGKVHQRAAAKVVRYQPAMRCSPWARSILHERAM